MFLICHMASRKHMINKKGNVSLWVEAFHG